MGKLPVLSYRQIAYGFQVFNHAKYEKRKLHGHVRECNTDHYIFAKGVSQWIHIQSETFRGISSDNPIYNKRLPHLLLKESTQLNFYCMHAYQIKIKHCKTCDFCR